MNRDNFALEGGEAPCWQGYEARGMKQKNGKPVPNCVKIGTGFSDFSRDDLRDIILHKNKVIADLEKHSYGSADFVKNLKGGAAVPTPKAEPKISPVATAAAALQPVRTAIQNGIGDALYGKSDDPKKQKKGLLGISEEGKEESQKKVMKNIVVPIVKTATALGKNVKDIANMIFDRDAYDDDMEEEKINRIKRDEAQAGIVRDKANPMIIIRKPRGYWTADTSDPKVEAYNKKSIVLDNVFYVRVPNPWKAAGLRPSWRELGYAGVRGEDLWTSVQLDKYGRDADIDSTLKSLHDDEFIWIPESRAKEIYGKLRQFVVYKDDQQQAEGYNVDGKKWTKGELKRFANIDPRTLKGDELHEWKRGKLQIDTAGTRNALAIVNKDIADLEAKINELANIENMEKFGQSQFLIRAQKQGYKQSNQEKLAKLREAKTQLEKRTTDIQKGKERFGVEDKAVQEAKRKAEEAAEIEYQKRAVAEFNAKPFAERIRIMEEEGTPYAEGVEQLRRAEFEAKPVAEKIAMLEKSLADPQILGFEPDNYTELLEQLRAEAASEKVEEQAQGSVDLLQQAQVVGGSKPTNPALYEKAKAIVNKSYPKHSAYRSGAYVKKYKEMGGEYRDEPEGKRPLERWFKEDWKSVGKKGEYPTYRPTKRISKDTPLTPDEIDPENLKLQIKEKQKIKGERNLSAFKKRGGADSESGDEELVGSGAVEYTLQKAGMRLFNPSGDKSKAGQQSFTPDYDAYGATVEEGRKNAFNLSRSMYDQSKAIELPDFKLVRDDTSLRFYRKDDEMVILVGIRGTDVKSWTDLYTWAVIGVTADLRMTTRFQEDLAKMVSFQRQYPPSNYYYVATGSSLAGSIADRFLELGLIEEAITYNPSIEKRHLLDEGILNHRVYLDTDPLFMLMGQYSPNTEIRVNPNKTNYYNPSKEKDYLIASHSIYPVYNSAFEGGGMEGSGKTYTLEEWKAIFDAKLEQKRKAIEAREAKKKQTAKAKRERAKAVRDGREKPKEPEVEVAEYTIEGKIYLVEEPREGLAFAERRVFDDDNEEIGNLTEDDVGKTLVMRVMRQEKLGAFADKSPKAKSSSESQQRNPAGEFATAKSPKELIDKMVEDAVKDIYYEEFPDFMKGTVSKEQLYRDKFLTLPKKKQDELRKKVRERVMSQLKPSGRGMKGGARPRKPRVGNYPPILSVLYDRLAAWDRPIDFGEDQAVVDAYAATVPVPDVIDLINDQSLVGTSDTMKAGQTKMRQLKNRLPGQIRSDMYYDDNYDREDWAGFANYHYQQLQLLRYLENMFPDDPARVMNIHERWSDRARRAGGFSGCQSQYYMG